MDAIFDDLTGLKINKATAYKIKVVQPNKQTLEIDCEFSEQVKNLVALAVGNGQRWFKWQKDGDNLRRVYSEESKNESEDI